MNTGTGLVPHRVNLQKRDDGALVLTSDHPLGPTVKNTGDWLHLWAKTTPESVFLAERSGDGWRELCYGDALVQTRAIAASLLERGLNAGDRLALLSGNGIDHALLTLAAQYAGIVSVPVAEQYSLIPGAHDRLVYIIQKTQPKMIYTVDADRYTEALQLPELAGLDLVTSKIDGAPRDAIRFQDLLAGKAGDELNAAHEIVGPDTLAKILFTSGSTSNPKGVCTTQRMMCVNQAQISACFPFLGQKPPKILDWLPWNHVFGGSHNFNMMLAHGGSLYIDAGKPTKELFKQTLDNLRDHTGNLAFNVPAGWALALAGLREDPVLRRKFFSGLELMFYAGASLPQDIWQGLQDLALEELGHLPLMTSSWGMTETAPAALMVHEPIDRSGLIGVPVPGVEVKLIPDMGARFELRVRGPNIMQAYYDDPEKTTESFDAEGYLITGDAVLFAEPDNPNAGLVFDGRISEDFKLMTGTWVQTARLRAQVLGALGDLAQDVVVTGQGRSDIGVLIFPAQAAVAGLDTSDGALSGAGGEQLVEQVKNHLSELAAQSTGSSTRVSRALILTEPPSLKNHEITAKGNLNISRVLAGRAGYVDRLYSDNDPATIII